MSPYDDSLPLFGLLVVPGKTAGGPAPQSWVFAGQGSGMVRPTWVSAGQNPAQ